MITELPFILTDNQITVILPSGGPKTVNSTSKYYSKIIESLKAKNFDEVIKLIDLETSIKSFFNNLGVEVRGGTIFVDGEQLPYVLSSKVLKFIEQDLPYEPLINFWNNLKNNPSRNSVQELYGCLEFNHHPITPDGCFIAYKAVDKNYLDKHTHTISNKIGETVKLRRNEVDDDKHTVCSFGLHVASFQYARDFMASYEDHLLVVKVNPEYVVSVPVDYNNQKLRVCEYTILSELPNEKLEPIQEEMFGSYEDEECDCEDCTCCDDDEDDCDCVYHLGEECYCDDCIYKEGNICEPCYQEQHESCEQDSCECDCNEQLDDDYNY